MAHPWVFEANFETGDNSEWDSESDTGSLLDFPHYSTLAKIPGIGMPFRGAYCMRVQPGDTNDHTVTEGDLNISADGVAWYRFYVWHNITATADDIFNIFEIQSSGAVEGAISLQVTASSGLVEIGIGETEASSFGCPLTPSVWHCIELKAELDDGGSNDGTLDLYVDGANVQQVTSLDQAAVTQGVLGTQGTLATTSGTILFDQFIADDARIGPIMDRWAETMAITKTTHLIVGPCEVSSVEIWTTNADNSIELYDSDAVVKTDSVEVRDKGNRKVGIEVAFSESVQMRGSWLFHRGCYVVLTGTNPGGTVSFRKARAYGSEGAVRSHAANRTPPPPLFA